MGPPRSQYVGEETHLPLKVLCCPVLTEKGVGRTSVMKTSRTDSGSSPDWPLNGAVRNQGMPRFLSTKPGQMCCLPCSEDRAKSSGPAGAGAYRKPVATPVSRRCLWDSQGDRQTAEWRPTSGSQGGCPSSEAGQVRDLQMTEVLVGKTSAALSALGE